LGGHDARHLALVRRAKAGDRIQVSDGEGALFSGPIDQISSESVHARLEQESFVPRPAPWVSVLQGLAKASKLDFLIQKLTELGVDELIIFSSGRTIAAWNEAKKSKALARWEKIAHEAAKQSHRAWLPSLKGPIDRAEAGEYAGKADFCLVADPGAGATFREATGGLSPGPANRVAVVVGPEGGLSADEVLEFKNRGALPVSLGSQVLRTETAGLVAASLLLFQFGRLG